jgi:methylated-DNA-protein-cysteine methyltransferase-like protein
LRQIEAIPEGCVATYGQVATSVGTGPRQVAQALRSVPEGRSVPWFRVINSQGKISDHGSYERQHTLLESEGITFENDRIDLDVYGWIVDDE